MRRSLSIFFVLLFGLGPLSAMLEAGDDAGLPSCCRRHGAHHCAMTTRMAAMMARAQSGSVPMVSAPLTCPLYPGSSCVLLTPAPALAASPASLPILIAHAHKPLAGRDAPLSSPIRAHAGRGPPQFI